MQIQIPPKAKYIIDTLQAAGFEAYVVGGCVRDSILGRTPEDWDITTSARPQQVKALFPRTIDTGIQHGTVTIMLDKEGFEVTTYRIDGKYEDSRHPKEITFTPNLTEDLKRRDFTINAMAYNDQEGLVDIFGGMEDIANGMIRCVGCAGERFSEDALRMMRAVRFSAQLGYDIAEDTKEAIRELAHNLSNISAERIQVELVKLVTSGNPQFLRVAWETGITKVILPEFDEMMETCQNHPHHKYSVGEHTLVAMESVEAGKYLRLAALFHDVGKPRTKTTDENGRDHFYGHAIVGEELTKNILKRLKFDNDTIHMVTKLVRYHDYQNGEEPNMTMVRRAVNKIGTDAFPSLLALKRADIAAQSEYKRDEKLSLLARWETHYKKVIAENQCVSLKMLAITGSDLIAAGVAPGPAMGEVLDKLLNLVLEDPAKNSREFLMTEALKYL